jgi:hypothetical protein
MGLTDKRLKRSDAAELQYQRLVQCPLSASAIAPEGGPGCALVVVNVNDGDLYTLR